MVRTSVSSVRLTSRSPVRTDAVSAVDVGLGAVDVDGGVVAEVLAVDERAGPIVLTLTNCFEPYVGRRELAAAVRRARSR